nr:baseplate assembly protein [uncultured Cohaesibacter sp.]
MGTLDIDTGEWIEGWPVVKQAISKILFPTRLGSRLMREEFGSLIPELLVRENYTNKTIHILFWCRALVIDLWEPRYKMTGYKVLDSAEARLAGEHKALITGQYMPRGHLGDDTVDDSVDASLTV